MSEWVSDYTPSIESMRETYRETWFYAPHTNSEQEKDIEFDRFLELVKQGERERIIKLLEEHGVLRPARWEHDAEIIALIKGENK